MIFTNVEDFRDKGKRETLVDSRTVECGGRSGDETVDQRSGRR